MGFTAYNWSDGKQARSVTEEYVNAASGKISAEGIGTLHLEQSDDDGYLGFNALHGRDAPPGSDGGAPAFHDPDTPQLRKPRRLSGAAAGHRALVEVVAQDPDAGEDIGHFTVPISASTNADSGYRQFVVRGPNGLIVIVPFSNNYGYAVAYRTS